MSAPSPIPFRLNQFPIRAVSLHQSLTPASKGAFASIRRLFVAFCLSSFLLGSALPFNATSNQLLAQDGENRIVDLNEIDSILTDQPAIEQPNADTPDGIDLATLILRGGKFMIPIGLMSLLVVALAIERYLALRRRRILPPDLGAHLRGLAEPIDRFSPAAGMRLCDEHHSPTSRIVRAMLMRTGRPLNEIEHAAKEALDREVERQAGPIRWLTLAAATTPLIGLLGTVWGMIVAFHESTSLTADRSRSEQLSEGIYTALVTTLAGLFVAIPAALLALYLENRLIKVFHRVEELCFAIAPGLARFAGKQRLDPDGQLYPLETESGEPANARVKAPSAPTPPPVAQTTSN